MKILNKNIFSPWFKISEREFSLSLTQYLGFYQIINYPISFTALIKDLLKLDLLMPTEQRPI
tara:strand:- start:479 stop:664 length:186 start_codon:yes stop_codon:yes gene_type:complete